MRVVLFKQDVVTLLARMRIKAKTRNQEQNGRRVKFVRVRL